MRKILFRGKSLGDETLGDWYEGSLVIDHIYDNGVEYDRYSIEEIYYGTFPNDYMSGYKQPVDPETVGQYTGMTDKNGTKIFEGDKVNITDYPFYSNGVVNYYGEVIWDEDEMAFALITRKAPNATVAGISDEDWRYFNDYHFSHISVFGNIYDEEGDHVES